MDEQKGAGPAPAGWYPDATLANTHRFWDGEKWTDQTAPAPAKPQEAPAMSPRKIALGVFWGIAAAIAGLVVLYNLTQPSEGDCALQRLQVATGEMQSYEMDSACR